MPTLSSMVEMMWARMGALIHRINLNLRMSRDYGPDHDHYKVIEGLRANNPDLARQGIQNDIRFSRIGLLTPEDGQKGSESASPAPRRRNASTRAGREKHETS
jgi:DNA-binding GntR family transcriptional regulator